jgi:hypothetical protein
MRTRILMMMLAVFGWAACAQAVTYNSVTDFSATSNPSGVWSYGRVSGSVAFTAFPVHEDFGIHVPACAGLMTWSGAAGSLDPSVDFNSTTLAISGWGYTWPAHSLVLDGNLGNETPSGYCAIRFTAPANGVYDVAASFKDCWDGGNHAATLYRVNDAHTSSQQIIYMGQAPAAGFSYSSLANSLAAGQTIDFVSITGTLTACNISITAIPEPSTLMLLGAGVVGLLCYASKKRK